MSREDFPETLNQSFSTGKGSLCVGNEAECVHSLVVDANIQFDQISSPIPHPFIVERGIAPAAALQRIEEIEEDLRQRQLISENHAFRPLVLHVLEASTPVFAQFHAGAHVVIGGENRGQHIGLFNKVDVTTVRPGAGILHHLNLARFQVEFIDN